MSVNTWPSTLGSPTIDGFTIAESAVMVRQNTHRGPPRFRQVFLIKPTFVELQFYFNASQTETFERFYWITMNAGTNQCAMNLYTYLGPLNLILTFYPYSIRYDSIIQASNVSFTASYNPPALTLLGAL
jgi:hypothetical protein